MGPSKELEREGQRDKSRRQTMSGFPSGWSYMDENLEIYYN
jgi:hypothetical protein